MGKRVNNKLFILCLFLFIFIQNVSATVYVVGIVNNASDGTDANGRTISMWYTALGYDYSHTEDTIGPTGASGAENIYFFNCDYLGNCVLGTNLSIQVKDAGDGYHTDVATVVISGGGYEIADNLTLYKEASSPIILSGSDILADVIYIKNDFASKGFLLKYNISKVPAGLPINSVTFCSELINYATDTDLNVSRFDNQTWGENINAAGVNAGKYTNITAKAFNSTTTGQITCFDITEAFMTDYGVNSNSSIRVEDPDRPIATASLVYDNEYLHVGINGALTDLCDSEGTSGCSPTPFIIVDFTTEDTTAPQVTIDYPENTTYTSPVSSLNFNALDETEIANCWYSVNGGITNSTLTDCTSNFSGLTSLNGLNTWTVYANDSSGNKNQASISFTYNPAYTLNITDPTTGSPRGVHFFDNITLYFNFTKSGFQIINNVNVTNITIGINNVHILTIPVLTQGIFTRIQDNIYSDPVYSIINDNYDYFSSPTIGNFTSANNNTRGWQDLKGNPLQDKSEAIFSIEKYDLSAFVSVWNGTAWGNSLKLCDNCSTSIASPSTPVEYETISGEGLVVYRNYNDNSTLFYRTWNGSWSSEKSLPSLGGDKLGNLFLIPNPKNNDIMLLAQSLTTKSLWASLWNGTAWNVTQELSNYSWGAAYENTPGFAWESLSGDGLVLFDNPEISNECLYRNFTLSTLTWSAAASFTCKGTAVGVSAEDLVSNPSSNEIFGYAYGYGLGGDLRFVRWDGNGWRDVQSVVTSISLDGKVWLAIAADRANNSYYFYTDADGGNFYYRKWNGTGLESPVSVYDISTSTVATHPEFSLHPTKNEFLLAFSADGEYGYTYYNGSGMSARTALNYDFGDSDKDYAFDYYTSLNTEREQLRYNPTTSLWEVNITVPSGTGLKNLFLEAEYLFDGEYANDIQSNAINYIANWLNVSTASSVSLSSSNSNKNGIKKIATQGTTLSNIMGSIRNLFKKTGEQLSISNIKNLFSSLFKAPNQEIQFCDYPFDTSSLVGWWTIDDYNITGVLDVSGKNNFGNFKNGLGTNNLIGGHFGEGINLNGSDYILPNNVNSLLSDTFSSASENWTISFWMNSNSLNNAGLIADQWGSNIAIVQNSGGTILLSMDDTRDLSTSAQTTPLQKDRWYHVVVVYANNSYPATAWIYINGALNDTRPEWDGNGIDGYSGFKFGWQSRSDTQANYAYFNGSLDEIMFFNKTLSATEVQNIYNLQSNKKECSLSNLLNFKRTSNQEIQFCSYPFNTTGLVSWWKMDENSNTVLDTIGTNNGVVTSDGSNLLWTANGKFNGGFNYKATAGNYIKTNSNIVMNRFNSTFSWWQYAQPSTNTSGAYVFTDTTDDSYMSHILVNYGAGRDAIFLETDENCNQGEWTQQVDSAGWHQYVVVFRDAKAYLYFDGVSLGESNNYGYVTGCAGTAATQLVTNMTLRYFGGKGGYEAPFNGTLDEIMFFNRSLTDSEINSIYNLQSNQKECIYVPQTGLIRNSNQKLDVCKRDPSDWKEVDLNLSDGIYTNVTNEGNFSHLNISDPQLVAYWAFDTPEENDNVSWIPGVFGNGLKLDGINDYVSLGGTVNELNASVTNKITLAGWFYPINWNSQTSTYSGLIGQNYGPQYGLIHEESGLFNFNLIDYRCWTNGTGRYSLGSNATNWFPLNTWTHIAVTYDNDTGMQQIYLNGVLSKEQNRGAIQLCRGSYTLSAGGNGGSTAFNGSLDEIMIFNRSLNATEIYDIYSQDAIDNSNGLVGYWPLNESSGFIANDISSFNNYGDVLGYTRKLYDYSNKSNDGLLNAAVFNSTAGYDNSGAYIFDAGQNQGIDIITNSGTANLNNLVNGSISMWIYSNGPGVFVGNNQEGKIYLGSSWRPLIYGTNSFSLAYSGAKQSNNVTANDYPGGCGLTRNKWQFLTLTWVNTGSGTNNSNLSYYINGVSCLNVTNWNLPLAGGNAWGIGSYSGNSPFNGTIDEVMVFNRTLTTTEIKQIYNGSLPKTNPSGEIFFNKVNLGNNDRVNIFLQGCLQINSTSIKVKINNGGYSLLNSTCGYGEYLVGGNLTNANVTIQLYSNDYNSYSPVVLKNLTLYLQSTEDICSISSQREFFRNLNQLVTESESVNKNNILSKLITSQLTSYDVTISILKLIRGGNQQILWADSLLIKNNFLRASATQITFSDILFSFRNLFREANQEIQFDDSATNSNLLSYIINLFQGIDFSGIIQIFNNLFKNSNQEIQFCEYPFNTTGLIGWWTMDNYNSTGILDSSGNNYFGSFNGGVGITNFVDGELGQALEFDGSNDYINTGKYASDLNIEGSKPKTICAWVYTKNFNNGGIFDMGTQAAGQEFCLRTQATSNLWRAQFWSTPDFDFTYNSLNEWVHFCLMYNGTGGVVYANGVEVAQELSTINTTEATPFRIGVYGGTYFNGTIDEVMIFDRALEPQEIQTIYNLQSNQRECSNTEQQALTRSTNQEIQVCSYPFNTTDLISWWKLNQDSSNQIDSWGTNDGSVVNAIFNSDGKYGGGYYYDGNTNYIDISGTDSFPSNANVTELVWARFDKVPHTSRQGVFGVFDSFMIWVESNSRTVYGSAYNGSSWSSSIPICTNVDNNTWYLLTNEVTRSGGYTNHTTYCNGVLTSTYIQPGTTSFSIGSFYIGGSSYKMNGTVDEPMVFNRSLTQEEIRDIYNLQSNEMECINPPQLEFNRASTQGIQVCSPLNSLCYQETANISTSCGGLDTGSYVNPLSDSNWYDGNYSTSSSNGGVGTKNMYINYTIPPFASSDSQWSIQAGGGYNFTFENKGCLDNQILQLKITETAFGTETTAWCLNLNNTWMYIQTLSSGAIYEEAMFWNITTPGNCSVITQQGFFRNFYQLVSESDLVTKFGNFFKNLYQLVSESDMIKAFNNLFKNTNQQVTESDIAIRKDLFSRISTTQLSFSDITFSLRYIYKNSNQDITFFSSATNSNLLNYLINIMQNIDFSSVATSFLNLFRDSTQQVSGFDLITIFNSFFRSTNQEIQFCGYPFNITGIVSWFDFDTSNNPQVDRIGGISATNNGAVFVNNGKFGGAYDFNDNCMTGSTIPLNGDNFTISVWVNYTIKADGEDNHQIIDLNWDWTNYKGYGYQILHVNGNNGKQNIYFGRNTHQSNTAIPAGEWHYLTITFNGTQGTFYLDGVPDGQFTETAVLDASGITIGKESNSASWRDFKGEMDELIVFNRSLSPEEVEGMYKLQSNQKECINSQQLGFSRISNQEIQFCSYPFNTDGLVGWWTMDNYNSTGVFEGSGNNLFATFSSGFSIYNITTGKLGNGISSWDDSTSPYLNIGTPSQLELGNVSQSIFAWIKLSNASVSRCCTRYIYATRDGSNGLLTLAVTDNSSGGKISPMIGTTSQDANGVFLLDNQWHYIGIVYNKDISTILYYTDGINTYNDTTLTGTFSSNAGSRIGTRVGATTFSPNGSIDEVMIFNRTLSQLEITQIYNLQSNQRECSVVPQSSLIRNPTNELTFNEAVNKFGNFFKKIYQEITESDIITKFGNFFRNLYQLISESDIIKTFNNLFKNTGQEIQFCSYPFNTTGLAGWWTMDNYNSTGIFDSSGNNNFGSFSDVSISGLSSGVYGSSFSYNGITNYNGIIVNNDNSIKDLDSFTLIYWIKPTPPSNTTYPKSVGKGAYGSGGWIVDDGGINEGGQTLWFGSNSGWSGQASYSVTTSSSEWTFVTFVVNRTENKSYAYKNSVPVNSPYTLPAYYNTNLGLYIGRERFNGSIDEVMIFNRTLSQLEITQIYNLQSNQRECSVVPQSSLIRNPTNELTFNEAVNKFGNFFKKIYQEITESDIITKFGNFFRNLYQLISESDIIKTFNNLFKNTGQEIQFCSYPFNTTGLAGWWTMDNYNSTGIFDSSGNNNFGSFSDVSISGLSSGVYGSSFSYNGITNYNGIIVNNDNSIKDLDSFTLIYWIKPTPPSNTTYPKSVGKGAYGSGGWIVDDGGINEGGQTLWFGSNSGWSGQASYSVTTSSSEWTFVTFVVNRTENKSYAYKNSVPVNSPYTLPAYYNTNLGLYIGRERFNGSIDEVMIFNRTLSQLEITQIYNLQSNQRECVTTEQQGFSRASSQNITYTDLVTNLNRFFRFGNQQITETDAVSRLNAFLRISTGNIDLSNIIISLRNIFKTSNQQITKGDAINSFLGLFRNAGQNISSNDLTTSFRNFFKYPNQEITEEDIALYLRGVNVGILDSITPSDIVFSLRAFIRNPNQEITTFSSMIYSSTGVVIINLVDGINLQEILSAIYHSAGGGTIGGGGGAPVINITNQTNQTVIPSLKCGFNSLDEMTVCTVMIGGLIWPSAPSAGFSLFIILIGICLTILILVFRKKNITISIIVGVFLLLILTILSLPTHSTFECGFDSLGEIFSCGYTAGGIIWPSAPNAGFALFVFLVFLVVSFIFLFIKRKKKKDKKDKNKKKGGYKKT